MSSLYSDVVCNAIDLSDSEYNFCEDIKALKEDITELQAINAELVERIENFEHVLMGFLNAYPEDIFPEPSKEEYQRAHELLSEITPVFGSRLHGAWGRHITTKINEALAKLEKK